MINKRVFISLMWGLLSALLAFFIVSDDMNTSILWSIFFFLTTFFLTYFLDNNKV